MDRNDPAYKGQADYSPLLLRLYDPIVLGLFAKYVWRCPADRLLAVYQAHLGPRHLDVGPGTGYFLEHAALGNVTELTILDPNPNVLHHVARRIADAGPVVVEADVCKPLPEIGPFDSAAMNLVIHCLPGPFELKTSAISHVAQALAPTGVLFGASVIGRSGTHNVVARTMMNAYNRRGAFDNLDDSGASLRAMLSTSFDHVELETVGSVAVFSARSPKIGGT